MIYVALIILISALVIGVPVPVSFMASCAWLIFFGGPNMEGYQATQLLPYGFTQMNSVSLIAIAMFILAGGIMERGKIAEKLIDMVDVFVGHIRGGLGIVAVVSCAVFGSICGAAQALVELGGATEVIACASHGVLSGPAVERIEKSVLKEVYFLDTVPPKDGVACDKIKYLSVAHMFAEAIERIYEEVSVSKLFL